MKKNFLINSENKKIERAIDSTKHEIKKYIARERRKELPEGYDYWDFDCKIGMTEEVAQSIHLSQINKMISSLVIGDNKSFYLEVLANPKKRIKK